MSPLHEFVKKYLIVTLFYILDRYRVNFILLRLTDAPKLRFQRDSFERWIEIII